MNVETIALCSNTTVILGWEEGMPLYCIQYCGRLITVQSSFYERRAEAVNIHTFTIKYLEISLL
jgi:hypothetical protein